MFIINFKVIHLTLFIKIIVAYTTIVNMYPVNNAPFSIYNASAGSGKTYTLVKEYLKIILVAPRYDAYRHILAITFTNKAVGEMKKRIVDCLSAFAQDDTSAKTLDLLAVLAEETKLNPEVIRAKSKNILKNIIHNYASFDISTIDKFTHRILRSFSFDLELPALFEVSLDTDELLTEAVDSIIAKAGEDPKLTQVLLDFTLQKTDEDKSWDISKEIFEMSKLLVNENDRKEISVYKEKSIADFLILKKELYTNCEKLQNQNKELAQQALQLIESNGIETNSFNRSLIPNALTKIALGTAMSYDKLEYLNEDKRYAKSKPQGQKAAIDSIADQLLAMMIAINQNAEKYYLYQAFLKNIIPLSLLNTVDKALHTIQKEKNVLSISEFNSIINKEIQNQPAPFIYERLGEKYRHFFIDEFQDTSEMQWQNLIPLIDNALSGEDHLGTRGTLLLVGDPKQSIYRWRGGKAEQFIGLTKKDNPFVITEKENIPLDTNYRSYSQIIEFNNDFFKYASSLFTNPDYIDLYANHSAQKTNAKQGGYVSLKFINEEEVAAFSEEEEETSKAELYLQATLDTINASVVKGFDYRDIVILCRKNSDGVAIANFLTENNIPIISSETLLMYWSTEIRMLIHVFEFIENPSNMAAKASILYYIAQYRQDQFEIHDCITEGLSQINETDFEQWLTQFDIHVSFKKLKRKSIYEMAETCIRAFLGRDKNHAYVQYFLDIVLEFDIRKQASLSDFIEFWHKKENKFSIPSPEGGTAVKIMSIHKSKGLEFPVVIVPFLDHRIANTRDKIWLQHQEDFSGLSKILVNKSAKLSDLGAEANEQYLSKNQEDLLDIVNVLYVAFTRAEEQLHLISSLKIDKKGAYSMSYISGFFGQFLESEQRFDPEKTCYEWGNPNKKSAHKTEVPDPNVLIQPVTIAFDPDNIKIAKREALQWDTKQGDAIEYGTILHEIIASITDDTEIENAIETAVFEGRVTLDDRNEIQHKITQIVAHPNLKAYFDKAFPSLNEQAILVKNGKTIKPDKIVLLPNKKALLLDYKTGNPEAKHKTQINEYALVLNEMGYDVQQKILVYIGEDIDVVEL